MEKLESQVSPRGNKSFGFGLDITDKVEQLEKKLVLLGEKIGKPSVHLLRDKSAELHPSR